MPLRGWDGEERLTVEVGGETLLHEQAQAFLDRRLPQNLVYFFLFDGEQIQELAEARREVQQREMERILGIGAIDSLREALNQATLRWQKDEMKPEARAELERLEGEARRPCRRAGGSGAKAGDRFQRDRSGRGCSAPSLASNRGLERLRPPP